MSKAKMVVPANLPGVQVPDGYILVQQVKHTPSHASNSNPQPTFGKNWNRNQRKRERKGWGVTGEPVMNSGPAPPHDTAEKRIHPVVPQAMGSLTAEAGLIPSPGAGMEDGDVVDEAAMNHPGYKTTEYLQTRADKLAVRNKDNLSAEVMLNHVKKLINYLYGFTRILASPDPGAKFEVVKVWRYSNNGMTVITGGNVISVVCEILFFFKLYGNPIEGDAFLTPALDSIVINPKMVKGKFLADWVEERILQLDTDVIEAKLDAVSRSDASFILKKFLNVLDNSGQLVARLPQGIYQPCFKFVGHSDEPRTICDAYLLGKSKRYNEALNVLVRHVQNTHVPLLGVNQINSLLKGTGLSLNRFTSFAQAEGRVVKGRNRDDRYPSSLDLLNLCGLPLPAQYQMEENQKLAQQLDHQTEEIQQLKEKLEHLINVQVQTSQQLKALQDIIPQMSGVSPAVTTTAPGPSIDDKQSLDSLLADDDGQDMEQDDAGPQHTEQDVAPMLEVQSLSKLNDGLRSVLSLSRDQRAEVPDIDAYDTGKATEEEFRLFPNPTRKGLKDRLDNQVWDLLRLLQERVTQGTYDETDVKLIEGLQVIYVLQARLSVYAEIGIKHAKRP